MSNLEQQKKANIIGFKETVSLGLQRDSSLLSPRVQNKSYHGEKTAILQVFNPTEVYTITGTDTLPETKYNTTKQDRRWISFETAAWAEVVNPFIKLEQNINPFDSYAKSAINAFKRHQDTVIIKGMLGSNRTGKEGEVSEPFPSDNIIRNKTGSSFKDTFAGQILDGIVWLAEHDVDIDRERITVAVPPVVYRSLFDIDQIINRDYVGQTNLDAGRVRYFAGVEILLYKKVPGDSQFPSDIKIAGTDMDKNFYCPMWCSTAVEFGTWQSINVSYDRLPTYHNAQQLLATASMGSARLEPNKIVCLEVGKSDADKAKIASEKTKTIIPSAKTLTEVAKSK